MGFDVSLINKIFVAGWTFSNVAQYDTSMAIQTHTEASRHAVKKEEQSEGATSQAVSRALVEIRRSNVATLDRRWATDRQSVFGASPFARVPGEVFSSERRTERDQA
jgi:hypothetical protein